MLSKEKGKKAKRERIKAIKFKLRGDACEDDKNERTHDDDMNKQKHA